MDILTVPSQQNPDSVSMWKLTGSRSSLRRTAVDRLRVWTVVLTRPEHWGHRIRMLPSL